MIWSRLSLSRKLFVAVVLPVLFAILLMAGAVSYSMRAGFSQYLLNAELAQMSDLAEALERHPAADEGWPDLADHRQWREIILYHVTPPLRRPGEDVPPLARGGPRPRPEQLPPPEQLPLPERLSLLAPDGTLLAGPSRSGTAHAEQVLRDTENHVIGRLRLTRLGASPAPADRAFLSAQLQAVAVAAAIALLCASLVAYATARQFLAPIRAIGLHVARLAAGDLDSRLGRTRADELGRMMADHDTLAENLAAVRRREKQWIADTSHELKTPLSVLRAQIEALQDGIAPTTPQALDSMHHAVMRLSRLTDDLSLLSRSDEERLPLTATRLGSARPALRGRRRRRAPHPLRRPCAEAPGNTRNRPGPDGARRSGAAAAGVRQPA